MGNRPSKPNRYRKPRYNKPTYDVVPSQPIQPSYNINGPPTMGNYYGQKTIPIIQQPMPIIQQPPTIVQQSPITYDTVHQNDEYVDVVGSDAGNMTVFSWITQLGTCCAAVCTLIVLIAFVIWMFINRNINTIP